MVQVGDLFGELGLLQNDVGYERHRRQQARQVPLLADQQSGVPEGAARCAPPCLSRLRLARCPHALNLRFVTPPAQLRAFTSMYPPAHLSVLPGPFFLVSLIGRRHPSDIESLV